MPPPRLPKNKFLCAAFIGALAIGGFVDRIRAGWRKASGADDPTRLDDEALLNTIVDRLWGHGRTYFSEMHALFDEAAARVRADRQAHAGLTSVADALAEMAPGTRTNLFAVVVTLQNVPALTENYRKRHFTPPQNPAPG